ncbi:unnamed protein product [Paramecium sonneborni]|uniref:CSC1/OSCA1-like cytosolic domain-containing protein n=1 Tax=Paramecium sonneborni TaxID=65129 RepID=A0A8S1P8P8_9CILI|nr:unnamed protein product [Paramecium sonneborni]
MNEIQPDVSVPHPSCSADISSLHQVSLEQAFEHRQANKVGRPKSQGRICHCCGLRIERENFNLGIASDQLGFLGSGYPLYFDFIKSCLTIIAIQYITVGNFQLITHIQTLFELSETEERLQEKQDVLCLTALYFTMIYLIYFRHNQIKLDSFCDLKQTTPGDYTVLFQGLPLDLSREELEFKIKEEFENVVKVCFIFKQIIKQKKNQRIFLDQLQDTYFEQNYFSGSALVSFKYKQDKLKFLKRAKQDKFKYYFKQLLHLDLNNDGYVNFQGIRLAVRQAPEPTDINWKSLNEWIELSQFKRILEIFINFILLIFLLVATCTTEYKKNKMISFKSCFTPLITIICYYFFPEITKRITFRKYISWTETQKSQSFKLTIFMSLFTIYVAKFIDGELFWLFACNSFLPPIFILLKIQQQIKNYKIKYQTQPINQDELNKLYELQQHNLTRNHAYINYTMIITNIYGNLMPINSILSFIGLGLYYWADKYVLLNHSTVKYQPSSNLSLEMFTLISYTPIIISCQHFMNSNENTISLIQLISAFIFYLIPKDLIINKIWKTKRIKEFSPYDESQFNSCYDRTNPALQDKAIHNWVNQQKKAHSKQRRLIYLLDEEQKAKHKRTLEKQLTKIQKQIGQLEAQLEQKQTAKLITQSDQVSQSINQDISEDS